MGFTALARRFSPVWVGSASTPFRHGFSTSRKGPIRLGQMPSGQVIEISHTNELQPGDMIYIQGLGFPGSLKYGSNPTFTVFGIDPGTGKVGVYDPDGDQTWFDGGTKAELLAKLRDLEDFDALYIVRPVGATIVPSGPVLSASEQELLNGAVALGLPATFGPLWATSYADLKVFDYVFSVAAYTGVKRLWYVSNDLDPAKMRLTLQKSDSASDTPGEEAWVAKSDILQLGNEMAFREGEPWPSTTGAVPRRPGGGIMDDEALTWTLVAAGGLALGLLFSL